MARYDVREPRGGGLVLECQADMLSGLGTCFVAPLERERGVPSGMERLNPVIEVDGMPHVLLTRLAAAVPVRELGELHGSAAEHHERILNAFDFLLSGF